VRAASGWTDLVLGPSRPAAVVSGLITGWHAPGASHLDLLEAVAGAELVDRAYRAAVAARDLWHEFGDSCLLLPVLGAGTGGVVRRRTVAGRGDDRVLASSGK
jgi:S-adenosylmethionine:tRNA ribosyltransferase-isomerase